LEPDRAKREEGISRLRSVLARAAELGAEMFVMGCGSHNPADFYGPDRRNHTRGARQRLVDSLKLIAPWAEEANVIVSLEGFLLTTLDTPRHIWEILEQVGSPWVKETFDPVNMIGDLQSAYASGRAMRRMWKVIGKHYAPCAHLKDVVIDAAAPLHLSEAPPGAGLIDYQAFFEVCKAIGPGTAVVIEHLGEQDALKAIEFVKQLAGQNGVTFAAG
jgi:sugar phosphate isomerase/epimerase